jgi:polyhydroxyalkanoate synthesis regulator protein
VLTQIIFEQEGKGGQALLPITFLRQLIRFYGDSMQMLVPSYLEFSIDKLTSEQQNYRDKVSSALEVGPLAGPTRQMFGTMEEQARKNMAMFNQALAMFNPFLPHGSQAAPSAPSSSAGDAASASDLADLKRQLGEMQNKLEGMSKKG